MHRPLSRFGLIATVLVWFYGLAPVHAQMPAGTAITYQGRLKDGGSAANNPYDFRFRLFDADTAGTQIGPIQSALDLPVVDGLFTATIDFGAGAFTKDARWLEIAVRPGPSVGAFTVLTPRQRIHPTPVAIQSLNDANWTVNGTDIYNSNTGEVAIGTTSATAKLDVRTGGTLGSVPDVQRLLTDVVDGANTTSYMLQSNQATINAKKMVNGGAIVSAPLSLNDTSSGDVLLGIGGGNVGINELAPIARLHVTGTGNLGSFLDANDLATDQVVIEAAQAWLGLYSDNIGAPASGISLSEINTTTGDLTKWSIVQRTTGNGGDLSITYGSDPAGNANPRFLQIKPTGDVSIGVDNPSAKLHVKAFGDVQGVAPAGLRVASEFPSGVSGTTTEYIQFEGNEISAVKDNVASTLELQHDGGQVNIGNLLVDSPKLTVSRDFQFISNSNLQFEDVLIHDSANAWLGLYSDNIGNVASGITLAEYGATQYKWAMYARTTDNIGDLVFTFGANTNPTANEVMLQIDRDGTTKVKVLEITGADVAERFPMTEKVEPGMVVEIDRDHPGQLCLAHGAYNRRVAGIVSGAGDIPVGAILGNMPGAGDGHPIALTGRVWVNADATEHAIEPGDLLTTSDRPGHAMALTEPARGIGATLGKTMTALEKGRTGLVLVLVNLQ